MGIDDDNGAGTPAGPNDQPAALKPCPCCEGEAWLDKCQGPGGFEFGYKDRTFWSVRCRKCDLRTPAIANPKSPVEIWNKRPGASSMTDIEKLRGALILIMHNIDYRKGACRPNEMIAACLPEGILEIADNALEETKAKEKAS